MSERKAVKRGFSDRQDSGRHGSGVDDSGLAVAVAIVSWPAVISDLPVMSRFLKRIGVGLATSNGRGCAVGEEEKKGDNGIDECTYWVVGVRQT